MAILLIAWVALLSHAADPADGDRHDLGDGATLFVPKTLKVDDDRVDILVHLHGAPSVIEPAFLASGRPGVLVEFNRSGLSSVYAKPFSDPALFPRILDSAIRALKQNGKVENPKRGRVVVSSFSAGFGGVREILKTPEGFDAVDALVMADSIYCGYEGNPSDKKVDAKLMAGFSRFAREAASGRKTMLITHSAQVPGSYASTTETADFLIREVEAKDAPIDDKPGRDWPPTRRVRKGKFEVFGHPGTEAADHMAHLRHIAETWNRLADLSKPDPVR